MDKKDIILAFMFFLTAILLRAPLVEEMQSHWDGPQYSIAIVRYSLEQETPAPPGYPLYIAMGKLVDTFTNNPHRALLVVSVVFSGIGAAAFYLVGKIIFKRAVGVIAALLFISGATFYYFGLTAYAYGITPVTSIVLATIVYLIVIKKKPLGFLLGALFAIILGIRPQEFFFLSPLFLLGLFYLSFRQKTVSFLSFLGIFFVWFIPFINIVGGIQAYIEVSSAFAKAGALPYFSIERVYTTSFTIFRGFVLSFGLSSLFLLYYVAKSIQFTVRKKKKIKKNVLMYFIFVSTWIFPSLLFNLFVRSEHAGYQMTYLSFFVFAISYAFYKVTKRNALFFVFSVVVVIGINLLLFFIDRDPEFKKPYRHTSFYHSEIRKNDLKLGAKVDFIKKNFDEDSTLIITSPFSWRIAMYHLPTYHVYDIDRLFTDDPKFKHIVREGKNWDSKQYIKDTNTLPIRPGIKTIVLFDDEAKTWDLPLENVRHYRVGMDTLISFSVPKDKKLLYDYGRITRYD